MPQSAPHRPTRPQDTVNTHCLLYTHLCHALQPIDIIDSDNAHKLTYITLSDVDADALVVISMDRAPLPGIAGPGVRGCRVPRQKTGGDGGERESAYVS